MNRKLASKVSNFLLGNGFYIALTLCVCLIALSGYYLMSSLTYEDSSLVTANAQIEAPTPLPETVAPVISKEKEESVDEVETMGNQAPESLDEEEETTLSTEDSLESAEESGESDVLEESTHLENSSDSEGQATMGDESEESPWSEEGQDDEKEEENLEEETISLYLLPVSGTLVQAHSLEVLAYHPTFGDWRTHTGVDIGTEENAPVVAIAAGHVSAVFSDDMMGTTVVLVHDNETESTYANLSENTAVEVGDSVLSGQLIGNVGNTAIAEANSPTHLQFSMTVAGVSVDPMEFLPPLQ